MLAEMFANVDRALSAKSTLVLHEFSDSVWREQLPLVAHLFRWNDLRTRVNTYDGAARACENARGALEQEAEIRSGTDAEGHDLSRLGLWFHEIAEEWIAAMRVLRTPVLHGRERQQLDEDIKKLEARIR